MAAKNPVITSPDAIEDVLSRGVIVDVLPSVDELRKALLSGKKLRFYIGADPTSTSLHLSHAKNYLLLEDFRKLGHEVIALFGTFTARIGDPSDRDSARQRLTNDEVKRNIQKWKKQISPILKFEGQNPARIEYNHKWLGKLRGEDFIELASHITVQHLLQRDMFERRMEAGKPVHLHEFLYPLMQGYDSVALETDVEVGGTDQVFNMLVGRTLMQKILKRDKFVIAVNLMENPKTKELMSKSRGTGVFLDSTASDMYASIMAQPDEMIRLFLINNTRVPLSEIDHIMQLQPKRAKERAAFEVVKLLHSEKEASSAQEQFAKVFSNREAPEEIAEVPVIEGIPFDEALYQYKVVASKSEARRLMLGGGVKDATTGEKITDPKRKIVIPITLKLGKHTFIKIVIKRKPKET